MRKRTIGEKSEHKNPAQGVVIYEVEVINQDELQRRGHHTVHGDRELAYWGDLKTGEPVDGSSDEHRTWIWDVEKVRALVADQNHAATFFCGGSRNWS